jgi:hypothetical protein
LYQKPPTERLNVENYVKALTNCVELNDCGEEFSMREYDLMEQDLIPSETSNCIYKIEVSLPDFDSKRKKSFIISSAKTNPSTNLPPDLSENDTVVLRATKDTCFEIEGSVKRVTANYFVIQIENPEHYHDPKMCPRPCKKQAPNHIQFVAQQVNGQGRLFDIRFKQLRVQVKMEKLALNIVEKQKLAKFLFPSVASSSLMKIERFVSVFELVINHLFVLFLQFRVARPKHTHQ